MAPQNRSTPRIAIVGGGLAGLALACILQTKGIRATLFERDEHKTARYQGGSLDLHDKGGQWALKLAGLFEQFEKVARYEDDVLHIVDKMGNVVFERIPGPGQGLRPEIDRMELRKLFLDALDDGVVRWNTHVRAVEQVAESKAEHVVKFADGTEQTFDMVVGADGAWSTVRPLLSSEEPSYEGTCFLEGQISNVDTKHPAIAAFVGRGSMFAFSEGGGILAQRNGHGVIRVYAALVGPSDWHKNSNINWGNAIESRTWLMETFQDWAEPLKDVLRHCDEDVPYVPRAIYKLPVGIQWQSKAGVTIIGDAAHLMSPFAGEGANIAMRDGAELGLAIAKAVETGSELGEAVAAFEQDMFERATPFARVSSANLALAFGAKSPFPFVENLQNSLAKLRLN